MQFTYTEPGEPPRVWEVHPQQLESAEAELIERVTGWTFQEYGVAFLKGSALAARATLFMLLRREQPVLKFKDLSIRMDQVRVDFDPEEAARLRAALDELDVDPQQREFLDQQLARLEEGATPTPAPVDVSAAEAERHLDGDTVGNPSGG